MQLQEIIPLAKNRLISLGRRHSFLVKSPFQISRHLAGQTGTERNDSFMVLFQNLHIYPRPVVIAVDKSHGHQFHQVVIAGVVLRQKHQVVIFLLIVSDLPVQPGPRSYVDFTA